MTAEFDRSAARDAEARRFLLFIALGGCAAAVNWLSRFAFERLAPFAWAVVAAYMLGMAVAFTLFSRFVFPASPRPLADQIKFFVAVNLAGIAQVWAVSMALAYGAFPWLGVREGLAEPLAHAIAIAVPTVSSYFGHRFLTFRGA